MKLITLLDAVQSSEFNTPLFFFNVEIARLQATLAIGWSNFKSSNNVKRIRRDVVVMWSEKAIDNVKIINKENVAKDDVS